LGDLLGPIGLTLGGGKKKENEVRRKREKRAVSG
jgi:hypothetical protein